MMSVRDVWPSLGLHGIAQSPRGGLAVPGMVWGSYPTKAIHDLPASRLLAWCRAWAERPATPGARQTKRLVKQVRQACWVWQQHDAATFQWAITSLRQQLSNLGLPRDLQVQALGLMAHLVQQQTGWRIHDAQIMAAAWMLDNHLVEMATGEGKSVAMVMAAGSAALAGVPVHLMTANDYLAQRDERQWQAVYEAAGLSCSSVVASHGHQQRQQAYQHDVVYVTAKEVAFDYLRDNLAKAQGRAHEQVLRGLCMAMIDEADSMLIDEASTPLILSKSMHNPDMVQAHRLALYLARALRTDLDFSIDAHHVPQLTFAGQTHLAEAAVHMQGLWQLARYRQEQVQLALTALHVLRPDVHYLVKDQKIHIIDGTTGRLAVGRTWSRGLHQMICIKEGVPPPMETHTLLDTSYQLFFPKYHRVCGLSGTLWEERFDLMATYGLSVLKVPLHQPCQRIHGGIQICRNSADQWQQVSHKVSQLALQGRAVLVGVNSVADSQALSTCLRACGVFHQVLNAQQDGLGGQAEQDIIERAGQSGMVTVATHMAGRGTDIQVSQDVLTSGGLHVINTHVNASARIDRQLYGRAGRQGQPGSSECVLSWDDPALRSCGQHLWLHTWLNQWAWLRTILVGWRQWRASGQLAMQRWALVTAQRGIKQQTALAGRVD